MHTCYRFLQTTQLYAAYSHSASTISVPHRAHHSERLRNRTVCLPGTQLRYCGYLLSPSVSNRLSIPTRRWGYSTITEPFIKSQRQDSNLQSTDYKSVILPIELRRHDIRVGAFTRSRPLDSLPVGVVLRFHAAINRCTPHYFLHKYEQRMTGLEPAYPAWQAGALTTVLHPQEGRTIANLRSVSAALLISPLWAVPQGRTCGNGACGI